VPLGRIARWVEPHEVWTAATSVVEFVTLMMRYVSLPPTHTIIHLPTRRLLRLATRLIDRPSGECGAEMSRSTRSVLSLLGTQPDRGPR
jgi:hypothetical protein